MKLINLTPHAINFVTEDGNPVVTIPASGKIARVKSGTVITGKVDIVADVLATISAVANNIAEDGVQIPITSTEYGEVEGLPAPEDGVGYIVSSLVAQRCTDRNDVFIPNESIRDSEGRIIGCKSLGKVDGLSKEQAAHLLGFPSAEAAWVAMMYS